MAVRVDDPIGPRLLSRRDGKYAIGRIPRLHRIARRIVERSDPGTYGFAMARMRRIDDLIRDEVAAGLDELVILGAGYDTRAQRMEADLRGVQVVEVDHPATSRDKRARLERVFGSPSKNVSYLEVDFTSQEFLGAMPGQHGQASARTLFVLSGVSMYLPRPELMKLLAQVAGHDSTHSSIVFDYFFEDAMRNPGPYYGAEEFIARVTKLGEEPRSGIGMSEVSSVLARCGLCLCDQSNAEELSKRYLRRSDGTVVAQPFDFAAIAHAVSGG